MASDIFESRFDVIVIGAGINGAGIARDAAMRGLKVLLLDKGDIGGGTSSWSTRLIHGGLRYLEHGEFGLVRESLRERACLLNISPHLVRPLRILVPIYKHARRGVLTIRAGMIAYDLLSFAKTLPRHRMLSVAETLQQAPGLNSEGLLGAAVYFDAQVEFAERLVLENALSAVEHGATVLTYARVDKLIVEAGKVCGVEFTREPRGSGPTAREGVNIRTGSGSDRAQSPTSSVQSQPTPGTAGDSPADRGSGPTAREGVNIRTGSGSDRVQSPTSSVQSQSTSGTAGVSPADRDEERHSATARIVINAAGPWIDELLAESVANSPRLIGGTKGSHLIVALFAGAPDTAIYVEAEADARPFFIIPWNENYLIGTTDIRHDGDLDHVRIETEEIDYLLRETNRVIPKANLTREHILYTYSGVRPLPFVSDKDEPSITRRHFIRANPRVDNLFSIVGGKLTTYRSLAEETVDLIFKQLGRTAPQCTTDREPLPGAVARPPGTAGVSPADPGSSSTPREGADQGRHFANARVPEATSDRLLRIYGTRASLVTELIAHDASLAEVFDPETGAIAAEVVFAFKRELAETLSDCLLRRTMVGLNSSCGLDAVEAAASVARKHLGWSESRVDQETDAYRNEISRRFCGATGGQYHLR